MSIFERVYEDIVSRLDRAKSGLLNCIPSPFHRFREVFPGLEMGTYYLFSANSKVGKTQIADTMCVYEPLFYAIEHNLKIHWFYFTWEMSIEQKYRQFLCHLVYKLSNKTIRLDTKQLRSVNADQRLPEEILDLLKTEEYQKYIKYFEENVTLIEDIRNPTGVKKFLEDYADRMGTTHTVKKEFYDKKGDIMDVKEVFDYYEPNDPELYNIVIFDHISLINTEQGLDLRKTIELFSNKILVRLRNRYRFTFVVIQQQAASQESNENFKLDKLRPTADGLADAKATFRDADVFFGLYSPYRYKIPSYLKYDITFFKDNIRFLELIGSREGGGGNVCPLYFDGAVNFFEELPLPTIITDLGDEKPNPELQSIYRRISSIRQKISLVALCLSSVKSKLFTNGNSLWNFWIFRRWKNYKYNNKSWWYCRFISR